MTREIINSSQVSRLLGLSELTVRKLARQGVIPGRKAGRKWLFSRSHLLDWVKAGEKTDERGTAITGRFMRGKGEPGDAR